MNHIYLIQWYLHELESETTAAEQTLCFASRGDTFSKFCTVTLDPKNQFLVDC